MGGVIAKDLASNHDVTAVDISQKNLNLLPNINTICLDIANKKLLQSTIKDFDIVVGAVPGFLGYEMMKNVIEVGKNIVDISFFPEDPFKLDNIAKKNNVTAVMDCGVAPGMGNIILGHHNNNMKITKYECLVGGLPERREWPYEYQAVFSPIDVIQEYIRPARYVENSNIIIREALSDTELINFEEIGTLESWNSDGLRTLIKTMPNIPNMIENGGGKVMIVSSVASFAAPSAIQPLYGPIKTFMNRFSDGININYKHKGITSTALCPGFTTTGFHTASGVQDEMDRVPKFMVFPAERIANEGVDAMFAGKSYCVPTKTYKLLVFLLKNIPQSVFNLLGKSLAPGRYDKK